MSHIKAFLFVLWNLTILCKFCLTALPQKPENISCIYNYSSILNCSWTSGREIPDKTKCSVRYLINETSRERNGVMENGSCIAKDISSLSYVTQVQLFGEEAFNLTSQLVKDLVKPDPPEIVTIEGMKEMLRVDLRRHPKEPSYDPFMCEIWYQATTKDISAYANVQIKKYERDKSLNLTGLWNFTNYTVAARCRSVWSSHWSDWSNKVTKRTEEQAPLKVDLWRVIETCPNGSRNVQLLWKLLLDMGIDIREPIVVYEDNQAAIQIASNLAKADRISQRTRNKDQNVHELVETTGTLDEMDNLSQQIEYKQGKNMDQKNQQIKQQLDEEENQIKDKQKERK
ncbi:PREDICTED: interleukin-31 receptor subunit alpha-like [Thamnophis sirtalis]|uniref:Interleukin-31 receptor subunit alpha-like n=1 Tax=Thamnophis sirtalis TaxID=35019 RepID=A0A6I9YCZ0_9SAUR|nr:PREDICTED: interleukin-31 receptor subunit alpha-like [Thamnophis sirtalis]